MCRGSQIFFLRELSKLYRRQRCLGHHCENRQCDKSIQVAEWLLVEVGQLATHVQTGKSQSCEFNMSNLVA